MISEKNVMRGAVLTLVLAVAAIGYNQRGARADGIPAMQPMTYAGTLEEGNGAVNGTRNLRLTIWDDAMSTESMRSRCVTSAQNTMVNNGRFQVTLDNACTAAIRSTPNLWLEIEVNGTSLGRTKLSAVPFAVEAARASELTTTAANALVPTGSVVAFAGRLDRIPSGWLPCDGRSLSRDMYSSLFNAIGTAHGGDGTNFNLPDYRGRFVRGVDSGAGRDPDRTARTAANMGGNSGDAVGSVQTDVFRDHVHVGGYTFQQECCSGNRPRILVGDPGNSWDGFTADTGSPLSGGGSETRPTNAYAHYIIKI